MTSGKIPSNGTVTEQSSTGTTRPAQNPIEGMVRHISVFKRTILGLMLACGVAAPLGATDFAVGLEAYDGGRYEEAAAAWKRAAAAGDLQAMNALANLYMMGEGVPPDPATAAEWYEQSARLGDPVGQVNLGDMTSRGVGVRRDPVVAYMWLGLAARQGHGWAARRLKAVAETMTPEYVAQGRARIAAWRKNRR